MSNHRCPTNRIYVLSEDALERIARILKQTVEAQITFAAADFGDPPSSQSIEAKVDLKALALEAFYEIAHQCAVRIPCDLPFKNDERCYWNYVNETIDRDLLTEF